jgi:hypothetical protein
LLIREETIGMVRGIVEATPLTPVQSELVRSVFYDHLLPARAGGRVGKQSKNSTFRIALKRLSENPHSKFAALEAEIGTRPINPRRLIRQFDHRIKPLVSTPLPVVTVERGSDWTVLQGNDEPMPMRMEIVACRGNKAPITIQWYGRRAERFECALKPGKKLILSDATHGKILKVEATSRIAGQSLTIDTGTADANPKAERLYPILEVCAKCGVSKGAMFAAINKGRVPAPIHRGHFVFYSPKDFRTVKRYYAKVHARRTHGQRVKSERATQQGTNNN